MVTAGANNKVRFVVIPNRFREGLKGRPPFPVAFFAPKLHSSKYNNHKINKITAVNAVQSGRITVK